MDSAIIPLCLYSNESYSLISLPQKTEENELVCGVKKLPFVKKFYVINPDLKPNPSFSDLFTV